MRLASFRIKNFKSIKDTGVCRFSEKDNILVLAGQNEAGKSAVLEALDFFANGPSINFEELHRRREEFPNVTCDFILTDEELENIYPLTKNLELYDYLKNNNIISLTRFESETYNFDEIYFTGEMDEKLEPFFDRQHENE